MSIADRNSKNISICVVLIIFSLHFTKVSPQVLDCAKIMMRVAKGILKIYAQCSKDFLASLNENQEEFIRRMDCVMKCVMDNENIGLLDEAQKVTNNTMQVFFDKFIPEDYHEIGHIMVEGCIEEYSPLMENSINDDTCSPYGGFVKCVQSIVAEAC